MDDRNIAFVRTTQALAILALGMAAPTLAQEADGENTSRYADALRECQAIDAEADRLACFDQTAKSIVDAVQTGDLRLVNREEIRQTRRKLFGFALPDLGIFQRSSVEGNVEDLDEIETTITQVSGNHSTGYLIRTAEGATWQISNPPSRLLEPRAGDRLHIRGGALSSYFVRIADQNGVKARRVR